ncbi:MAG: peptide deformylase, partial [Methylococcales bacterium]|nr:peptide deformylase [Methylococcales bacterium]
MSILTVLEFPDKRLRKKAKEVAVVNDNIKRLVDDMFETMYRSKGVGLAATQVNVHQRVIVLDTSEEGNQPICLINPEIIKVEGEKESNEGCLSVPSFFEDITRAETVKIKALDKKGKSFE